MPFYDYRTSYPDGTNADNPIIIYDQFVFDNPNGFWGDDPYLYPLSNLGNPSTAEYWQATGDSSTVLILPHLTTETDCVAFAPHNLKGRSIRVEAVRDVVLVGNWEVPEPEDNSPFCIMFGQTLLPGDYLRFFITYESGFLPRIGMAMAGKALVLPNRINAGHTPINYGRKTSALNGMSESGEFLGRVILNEVLESGFSMENIDAQFYREHIDPFATYAIDNPFVIAWRPGSYPLETALCWATNDIQMENRQGRKKVGFSVRYRGHRPWQV